MDIFYSLRIRCIAHDILSVYSNSKKYSVNIDGETVPIAYPNYTLYQVKKELTKEHFIDSK